MPLGRRILWLTPLRPDVRNYAAIPDRSRHSVIKPAMYRSRNSGKSWLRLDQGLPRTHAWFTVLRQAMCVDASPRVGLYFGTTQGEVWASSNEGDSWRCLIRHLPEIYSVTYGI